MINSSTKNHNRIFILLLVFVIAVFSFEIPGVQAKSNGYVCNNSTTKIFIVIDSGNTLYGVIDPSWAWLKPGECTDKNRTNVLAIVGRYCSTINPRDCIVKFWKLNGGGADVANSVFKGTDPKTYLSIIPRDKMSRMLKNNEDTGFLLEFLRNKTFTYSITGNHPRMYAPVTGVGEGITTPIGSTAHTGPDKYAIDYQWREDKVVDVYPVLPGKIVFSGCLDKDYGCTVVIRHHDKTKWEMIYYSLYAHLDGSSLPVLGTKVDGKRPIGRMSKSGLGSNDIIHLHFAMRYGNNDYEGTTAVYGDLNGKKVLFPLNAKLFMR